MENRDERTFPGRSAQSNESLIESAFTQIRLLGSAEQSSLLFPNGVKSLELEISAASGTTPGGILSLKISAADAPQIDSTKTSVAVMLEGDVEPTFNAEGHHVVAFILEQDLNQHFPGEMQKVQKILDDGGRTLTKAATFPDDIRNSHPETKPFHFVDIPFRDHGPSEPPLPHSPHVISQISEFSETLKNTSASHKDRVDALSWLIHLFGDIHQPLHCIEHINEFHPGGDRGGNSFLLKGKARNLHSLWDSSVNFKNAIEQELAVGIIKQHPRSSLQSVLQNKNVEDWARSSFDLAKKFAYGPLHENPAKPPTPNASYLKKAEEIGRRQAAIAGYRLSDRLRSLLS